MKLQYAIALLLILVLALTSCGSPKEASDTAPSMLEDTYADALSIRSQKIYCVTLMSCHFTMFLILKRDTRACQSVR